MLNKQQMHDKIVELVKEYCDTYHNQERPYIEGERIPYASRVYDHEEMCNLVDSALEFWLTSGRYLQAFEKGLAEYLGVKYVSVVKSGSSANQLAFMTLTSPLLGERRIQAGGWGYYGSGRLPYHCVTYYKLWGGACFCGCDYIPVQY